MKTSKFFGRRIIKTGIAVFLTATVCLKLGLPVIFAVITAIVTTEPTARDSLKKGMIRLPAAAIGAGFALLFDLFLGQSAITFALVAMLTIVVCHHMKLDNGTLVATLTAVAMIPGSNEGLISEFIFRLSGTSLGIIISTFVNFAILPPKFGPLLVTKVNELYIDSGKYFKQIITELQQPSNKNGIHIRKLNQQLENAFMLSEFQQAEWQYRKKNEFDERSFYFLQKKLTHLQKLISHITNISHINLEKNELSNKEKAIILEASKKIITISINLLHDSDNETETVQQQLYELFKKEVQNNGGFQQKKALFYDLWAMLDCLISLQKETKEEHLFSTSNKNYPTYIFEKHIQYE